MSDTLTLPTAEQARCLNCTAELHGPFCAQCGQEHVPGVPPIREYFRDLVDALFDFDSKVLRSLWPLVARPGFLTREFLSGRRVPYFLPSRLYFLISLVFFFLVNYFDPVTVEAMGMSVSPQMAAGMNDTVTGLLPPFMLGVIPAFAVGMGLVYVRRDLYFSHHLAFAFHLFAFVFVAFTLPVLTHSDLLWNLACLGIPVYLFLALRRVHPQPFWKVAAKSVLLYLYFWLLLLAYFGFVFLVAWMRTVT